MSSRIAAALAVGLVLLSGCGELSGSAPFRARPAPPAGRVAASCDVHGDAVVVFRNDGTCRRVGR
jgi:hypothetical protein